MPHFSKMVERPGEGSVCGLGSEAFIHQLPLGDGGPSGGCECPRCRGKPPQSCQVPADRTGPAHPTARSWRRGQSPLPATTGERRRGKAGRGPDAAGPQEERAGALAEAHWWALGVATEQPPSCRGFRGSSTGSWAPRDLGAWPLSVAWLRPSCPSGVARMHPHCWVTGSPGSRHPRGCPQGLVCGSLSVSSSNNAHVATLCSGPFCKVNSRGHSHNLGDRWFIIPTLQRRKRRHREVMSFPKGTQ